MNIETFMERIGLPGEARLIVRQNRITESEYKKWSDVFYQDIRHFIDQWKEHPDRLRWALELYVKLALEKYEAYRAEGISDEIYAMTFRDITIWCEECYRRHGIYGLEEIYWLSLSVKMQLFRLGRLQFEPTELREEIHTQEGRIENGTKALNVHIPADGSLSPYACEKSFYEAGRFFEKKYQIYVCDSWLLSPHLKELLLPDSNILRFQNLFEVVKVYYSYPQAEQRIFGEIKECKIDYPEDTVLQKNAKKYILKGGDIGIGVGIIHR